MTTESSDSIFKEVDVNTKTNSTEHHTSVIAADQLIVRRGQAFTVTLTLTQAFNPDLSLLAIDAVTGDYPSEEHGTKSCFGIPDTVKRSPSAKALWKVELHKKSSPLTGILVLTITPPANAPVGQYTLSAKYRDQEMLLVTAVVLFNPWCPDDWVFLSNETQRQEYVMNEQGIIYRGSRDYINSLNWDYGQFEDNMVNICLKILDINNKHLKDPADDESARCNPIYVGRVVSAMINSQDDRGLLEGKWGDSFSGGVSPSRWNGSHAILKKWFDTDCSPVKYGQCWVFAGVMCSVMRLLGIPCRVVTNFSSAHDSNKNLVIDVYHSENGVMEKETNDSIWNFHVWVEGWMRRPDLSADGKYDGWQVLDPTPQEKSDGMYCCGPASVNAVLNGETQLKYDVPFIFAEVNADYTNWLIKADGSKVSVSTNTKRVGQNISTKSVGSNERADITNTYKYEEGSEKEREVYKHACSTDYPKDDGEAENAGTGNRVPPVTMRFEEVSKPINGQDLNLNLVMRSESTAARPLSINISVQAMRYHGSPSVNIQSEVKEETMRPGKDLIIPILVPFSTYHKGMLQNNSMRISAMVIDKDNDNPYLAVINVVLTNPQITMTVSGDVRLNREANVELVFMNPVNKTLKNCSLTVSGSGLMEEQTEKLPDLLPNNRLRKKFTIVPYKSGQKTLVADFDCSIFRHIKASCSVRVKP